MSGDILKVARVLVGDSVFEDATISTHEGWLHVEFDAPDLDNIAIPLVDLGLALTPQSDS